MNRRSRSLAVVTILVGGALALIASTQTWLDVVLRDAAVTPLAVAGAVAVPLLAPLSLAALALGLALTIVGPVLRYVFAVVGAAIGLSLVVSALRIAIAAPLDTVASTVTESTGLSGTDTIAGLVHTVTATPWPAVTAVAALAVIAGSVFTLLTARRWPGAGRRYRTEEARRADVSGSRPHDAIDSWDDLSRGDDPTA
ncbi:Trp biosynthesis-associated membrane protein [Microbacterium sp. TNHR37B]|uniref:Trp biosynthesis-associated membrane protein n=1 Tax=Microbacterium sp. TNHR37B TaxID=1775956 RepID=UPI0007B20FFF|nr:Trp biosynthesis-associated membrane protein [Microbacterium sp. TNHR37B]KZE90830.1 hypothetical protein AVP41_00351 [Microbacterium sp. TNHR37B]